MASYRVHQASRKLEDCKAWVEASEKLWESFKSENEYSDLQMFRYTANGGSIGVKGTLATEEDKKKVIQYIEGLLKSSDRDYTIVPFIEIRPKVPAQEEMENSSKEAEDL